MPGQMMDGTHWAHIEFPQVFNGFVRAWLAELEAPAVHDEL